MRAGQYSAKKIMPLFAAVAILMVGLLYVPGMSGSFHFDDNSNLKDLASLTSIQEALLFVVTNESGPTGRPIAMLSFLINSGSYPDAPSAFIATNILLHLINGLLVFIFAQKLVLQAAKSPEDAWKIAALGAFFWVILPIHAATIFLIVQRMAILSTTFVLLGLIGYLIFRARIGDRPVYTLSLMLFSMLVFGGFGILTKENAAVLPLLLLVSELTVLKAPEIRQKAIWRSWVAIGLVLPSVVLLGYIASRVPYSPATVEMRGFTAAERLLTQSIALWDYLRIALIPRPIEVHPFYDAYPLVREYGDLSFVLSAFGWFAATVLAFLSRYRAPFVAFGIFWYLGGHVLESTVIPIEPYFLHRNYLPLIGVAIMAASLILSITARIQRTVMIGVSGYVLLLGAVLFNTASIWGEPEMAARLWIDEEPRSPRAVGYQLEQLVSADNAEDALGFLEKKTQHPERGHLYEVQKLLFLCAMGRQLEEGNDISGTIKKVRHGVFTHALPSSIKQLATFHLDSTCNLINLDDIRLMAETALSNNHYEASRSARHSLNKTIAEIAIEQGKPNLAVEHLLQAIAIRHDPGAARKIFQIYQRRGDNAGITRLIAIMREDVPSNPVTAKFWLKLARAFENKIAPASAGAK